MKDHIAQYGTVLESWFPLGGRGNTRTLFNDPVISGIAKKHEVSSAQVIIRWHLQADRKSTRLNSSHPTTSRMPSSA